MICEIERIKKYLSERGDGNGVGGDHVHGYNGNTPLLVSDIKSLIANAERYQHLRNADDRLSADPWPKHGICWVVQYHHPKGTIPETRSAGFGAALDAIIDIEIAKEKK